MPPLTTKLETLPVVQVDEQRDKVTFKHNYARGLADQKLVEEYLKSQGHAVLPSAKEDDLLYDVDCYLDGVPTSIKAQHKGASFGNIYFELKAQLTSNKKWVNSWYFNGKAEQYLILQGNVLRLYKKTDVEAQVESKGWLRQRTLSASVKATQGGSYRYSNSLLGFLNISDVAHKRWVIGG